MKWRIHERIDDQVFIKTCEEAESMASAAATLGLHFNSFKKRAVELRCYKPNQAGMNHLLENLQILCPNCHNLTDNFRAKNKQSSKRK